MKETKLLTLTPDSDATIYRLTLRTLIYPAHDQIVAYALDGDLLGAGYDEEEAIAKLRQTVKIFLEDAVRRGGPEELTQRKAHDKFFTHWKQPPFGVESGYLSMSLRLNHPSGIVISPPQALKCA